MSIVSAWKPCRCLHSLPRHCLHQRRLLPETGRWETCQSERHRWPAASLPSFTTKMLAPSNAAEKGETPTGKLPRVWPSLARSLVTLLLPWSAPHTLAPSKATPVGEFPAAKVPSTAPSLARSFVTVLASAFDTHILLPSKTTSPAPLPTANVAV